MREVCLDIETTGMNKSNNGRITDGHRVIEIGCVEIIDRKITGKTFHVLLNPRQKIDPKASAIHGFKDVDLKGKPTFEEISERFLSFISDSDIIIHNAPFDTAFLDKEFLKLKKDKRPSTNFSVIDTLELCRNLFPGVRNDLNSLRERLGVDQPREKHGALVDALILAEVYLKLT